MDYPNNTFNCHKHVSWVDSLRCLYWEGFSTAIIKTSKTKLQRTRETVLGRHSFSRRNTWLSVEVPSRSLVRRRAQGLPLGNLRRELSRGGHRGPYPVVSGSSVSSALRTTRVPKPQKGLLFPPPLLYRKGVNDTSGNRFTFSLRRLCVDVLSNIWRPPAPQKDRTRSHTGTTDPVTDRTLSPDLSLALLLLLRMTHPWRMIHCVGWE